MNLNMLHAFRGLEVATKVHAQRLARHIDSEMLKKYEEEDLKMSSKVCDKTERKTDRSLDILGRKFIKPQMHTINIAPVNGGFDVQIGCTSFFCASVIDVLSLVSAYMSDPGAAQSTWSNLCGEAHMGYGTPTTPPIEIRLPRENNMVPHHAR